jgi:hypothetical protein
MRELDRPMAKRGKILQARHLIPCFSSRRLRGCLGWPFGSWVEVSPRKDDGHHNWPWSTFNGYSRPTPLMNDGSIPFLAFPHSVAPRPFCVIDPEKEERKPLMPKRGQLSFGVGGNLPVIIVFKNAARARPRVAKNASGSSCRAA